MNRIKQREQAFCLVFQDLFKSNDNQADALSLYSEYNEELGDYAISAYKGVCQYVDDIDKSIAENLKGGWKINRLPKVNLAILRLAVYEIFFVDDVPNSVAINEAVELAKKYSGKEDAPFINGVLGGVVRGIE